jgi:hypothetical protein
MNSSAVQHDLASSTQAWGVQHIARKDLPADQQRQRHDGPGKHLADQVLKPVDDSEQQVLHQLSRNAWPADGISSFSCSRPGIGSYPNRPIGRRRSTCAPFASAASALLALKKWL